LLHRDHYSFSSQEGIKVGGSTLKAARFADDQAVVAGTQKGLHEFMTVLHDTSKEYGMKKTNVMHISRKEGRKLAILIEGHTDWTKLKNFYVRQLC